MASVGVVYGLTTYLTNTQTFTVGNVFMENGLEYQVNGGSQTACTVTGGTGSCPTYSPTLFAGDQITYNFCIETDKSGVTPTIAQTSGTYTVTQTDYSTPFTTYTGSCFAGGNALGSGSSGIVSPMVAGKWYDIAATFTLAAGSTAGSLPLQFSVEA